MTIVINLGLHGGRIGGIFITGIFTLSGGEFLTFKTGIPGGLGRGSVRVSVSVTARARVSARVTVRGRDRI